MTIQEKSPIEQNTLEQLCINTIRTLSMDGVQKANSGHPGTPMALAPLTYLLWTRTMRYNPRNPSWLNRDRFILSAGHASMLQYSMLHLTGYDLPLEQLKNFRQWGSHTPGHPEYGETPGIETTTGPLGKRPASKQPPAPSDRASPTASAWPSLNASWQTATTARTTPSSITTPTPSAATATSWRASPPKPHHSQAS
jgi:hypothetical protein